MKTLRELIDTGDYKTDKDTTHAYIFPYDKAFEKYRDKTVSLLEIGNNGGESIKLWNDYFNESQIFGIEINDLKELDEINAQHENINLYTKTDAYCDETVDLFRKDDHKFDIIIDDGSHRPEHQAFAVIKWLPFLKEGGVFIIEDVQSFEIAQYLMSLIPEELLDRSMVVDRRHVKGRYDDVMIIVEG